MVLRKKFKSNNWTQVFNELLEEQIVHKNLEFDFWVEHWSDFISRLLCFEELCGGGIETKQHKRRKI